MTDPIEYFPITVEQTDWQSSKATLEQIRRKVFIEEQSVPEADEWDGKDEQAIHWIAFGAKDEPIATARLVNNKVGRMAVLKPHRSKGVGSTILRTIVQYAINKGLTTLVLDAQLAATGFYEDNGFEVTGDEFMDAGIPHRPMKMDLDRFVYRHFQRSLPGANDTLHQREELNSPAEFADAAVRLAESTQREIRILSDRLDPPIFDSEQLCRIIRKLALEHPNFQVKILVRDTVWLGKNFHLLVELWQKLQSHIELRRLTKEIETPHKEFMTGDGDAVLYFVNPEHYLGYLCLYSPVEVRRLNNDFDNLWNFSEPDPQVRRLYI